MKVKLKDVANISAGQGAPQGDSSYSENGIPFVKAGDLLDLLKGKPIINIQKVTEDIARKYKLKLYSKGTVLFAKSGMSCLKGYVYTLPSNAYVVSHLACITPNIDISKFLQYYFNYYKPNQLVKDKSYPSISLTDIGNMMIDLKTPEKRILIVTVLDKVSDLIALRKKQLAKLDELVKARFVEMFGDPVSNEKNWPVKKIKNVSPIVPYKGQFDSKVWLLNLDMVEAQTGRILDYVFVDRKNVGNSTCTFDESNILYSKLRPYLNKVVLPDRNGYATSELLPLKPEKCLNKIFLANLLRGNSFVNFISEKVSGAKMPRVVMKDFNNFDCIVPPIELQQQFADFVGQVDKQKLIVKQSLEKLETLKKSLMQEYFG